jgi:hypothetical protein
MIKENSNDMNETIKELVIARIEARMSKDLRLSVGSTSSSLTKNQLIAHIKKGDEIGRQIVRVHLNFLKAQATGELHKALLSV